MKALELAEKLEDLDVKIQDFKSENIKALSTNFYKKSWKKLNEIDELNNYLFELFCRIAENKEDEKITENVRDFVLNFEKYAKFWINEILDEIKNKKGVNNG